MSKLVSILYIPAPSGEVAQDIVCHLLEKKLIGCANIFKTLSVYPWKDKNQFEDEMVLVAKTTSELAALAQQEVESIHPYEVPCIVRIEAHVNDTYFSWLSRATQR